MESFIKDLKHSLRMFAQSPAFTLAAIAALTLGIGVNTAIFSVVNAVLLRPVPMPEPNRVVMFLTVSQQGAGPAASPAKFQHFRLQTNVVQDVSAFGTGIVNYTGGSLPEQIPSGQVSAGFFRLFGASPAFGRTFTAEEDRPGGGRVAVLSHGFWSTRCNRDPDIVGKAVSLSGEPYTVVGVLREFNFEEFGLTPRVWTPFQLDPNTVDQGHFFTAAARIKPGVTLEQVETLPDGEPNIVRCPDVRLVPEMIRLIEAVRKDQDSIGGVAELVASGVPAGLGEPVFDKLKADREREKTAAPAHQVEAAS